MWVVGIVEFGRQCSGHLVMQWDNPHKLNQDWGRRQVYLAGKGSMAVPTHGENCRSGDLFLFYSSRTTVLRT